MDDNVPVKYKNQQILDVPYLNKPNVQVRNIKNKEENKRSDRKDRLKPKGTGFKGTTVNIKVHVFQKFNESYSKNQFKRYVKGQFAI